MAEYVDVGRVAEFPDKRFRIVDVGGLDTVGVYRDGEAFHALENVCPHQGGPVAEGDVEEGIVTCPWHVWRFRIDTGEFVMNPAVRVRRHEVRVREDGVVQVSREPVDPPRNR